MDEFNNRIDVQRKALSIINAEFKEEPLFGLSKGAIDRWVAVNRISQENEAVRVLLEIAEKLFFLANKSQQQITREYQDVSRDIEMLLKRLSTECRALRG